MNGKLFQFSSEMNEIDFCNFVNQLNVVKIACEFV